MANLHFGRSGHGCDGARDGRGRGHGAGDTGAGHRGPGPPRKGLGTPAAPHITGIGAAGPGMRAGIGGPGATKIGACMGAPWASAAGIGGGGGGGVGGPGHVARPAPPRPPPLRRNPPPAPPRGVCRNPYLLKNEQYY